MMRPERGKLIPVEGNNNRPDMDNAIDVQFNPTSLKVSLSNTLKENQRGGNSRASQFVDKSSSSLTVELFFDSSYIDSGSVNGHEELTEGGDVRNVTKLIAERFIKPQGNGRRKRAPKRCLFQWGSFEFIGLVESYEETLDFFSKEGRPLRATVSLKLKEDRFQFRQRTNGVAAADNTQPTFTNTGAAAANGADGAGKAAGQGAQGLPGGNQNATKVPGSSGDGAGSWRDNAMFNGIENPRLPTASSLALPKVGLNESTQLKAEAGFKFGQSSSLGSSIPGSFCGSSNSSPLTASDLLGSNSRLSTELKSSTSDSNTPLPLTSKFSVGFD
jgi:hypothetical protein